LEQEGGACRYTSHGTYLARIVLVHPQAPEAQVCRIRGSGRLLFWLGGPKSNRCIRSDRC
jgi:hypothetical protein